MCVQEIWRSKLESILDAARDDSEPWVCMLAELMKTYPGSGQLNSDIHVPDSNRKIFGDLVSDLKKALRKSDQSESVLPLECHFLNKNAFISAVGHMPQTQKHFTLKRKPKAAALKAELIHKSQDAANKVKSSSGGAFPMRKSTMPRKMTSDLKGLPSRTLGQAGFRNHGRSSLPSRPTARKPGEGGGVKLLDINEQPVGYALAKKRKKQQEEEEKERAEKEKKERREQERREKAANLENSAPNAAAKGGGRGAMPGTGKAGGAGGVGGTAGHAPDAMPDYAAGLTNLNPPTPAGAGLPPPSYAPPTPTPIQAPQVAPPPPSQPSSSIAPPSRPPPVSVLTPASAQQASAHPPSYAPPRVATVVGPPSAASVATLVRPPPPGVSLPTTPVPPSAASSAAAPAAYAPFPAGLSSLEPLPQAAVRSLPPS